MVLLFLLKNKNGTQIDRIRTFTIQEVLFLV